MIVRFWPAAVFFLAGLLTANPSGDQRIISLSPSLTKMIYLLEADDQLVGRTSFSNAAGEDKEVVASQMNVNTEKIVSMKPDLVITTDLTPAREIRALREVGVEVRVLDLPVSFDALCDQFVEMGRLTGKETEAAAIVDREKARLERLRETIPGDSEPRIFMQLGAKPLFSAIPETFMNDYIRLAGGVNIVSDVTQGSISRESVLIRDPEVILIVMMGLTGREEKQNWQSYPGLSAAENNKIFLIDEDQTSSPTPVTFVNAVEEIIDLIYP